ncbi:MAG: VOC family protein [Flavobacteriales bacterium]|nr:VOC family protein [Flavobacteriales bacterium]
MNTQNNHINYIEFKAQNLAEIKRFYTHCFGWTFADYGPDYIAFDNSGLQGGFEYSDEKNSNGVLVVLYHENLEEIRNKIVAEGGRLIEDIFSFPGGKRFHFQDPSGNELAVWSD